MRSGGGARGGHVGTIRASVRSSCLTLSAPQNKYKEEGKKEMSSSLYSQLPQTSEMQLAKTVHEFQSEVLTHGAPSTVGGATAQRASDRV